MNLKNTYLHKYRNINKFLFSSALFLAPFLLSPAISQTTPNDWAFVGMFNEQNYYLNHSKSRRSGSRIQIFSLIQLNEPAYTTRGKAYKSKRALIELDCQQKTLLVAQDIWFSKEWAKGEIVFENTNRDSIPIKVEKTSPSEAILTATCNRK